MKRFRMPRRERVFGVLPTLLTLGNAVCGFGAITFAAKVGLEPYGWGRNPTDCLWIAAILIFLAMVFDMLDGRAARWAKQTSEFGAELDSLCDAVSFGVAPAVMLIKFTAGAHSPMFVARILWMIAVLYVACAILRLARFNVETDDEDTHEYFSGLPSPAAAGTVASFMIALPELESLAGPLPEDAGRFDLFVHDVAAAVLPALQFVLPVVALACACLMVSRVRYSHVFNQWFRGRRSYRHILRVILGLAIAVMFKELAVPLVFVLFSFEAPIRSGWRALTGRGDAASTASHGNEPSSEDSSQQPPQIPGSPLAS
jgi:CDP-diacylglycerol--serine O-phosphatidyltransferase